jgi:hypothetical protein
MPVASAVNQDKHVAEGPQQRMSEVETPSDVLDRLRSLADPWPGHISDPVDVNRQSSRPND